MVRFNWKWSTWLLTFHLSFVSGVMDGFPKAKKIKQDIEEEDGENETSHKASLSTVESSPSKERHSSSAQSNAELVVSASERGGVAPSISDELLAIEQRQCSQLLEIEYPSPVTHVYNPLSYASKTHENFVRRYGNSRKKILFVGMNPGPFGMAQNGVGDVMYGVNDVINGGY